MFNTYFSTFQLSILTAITAFHILSIYFFVYQKNIKYAFLLLFIGSVIARLFIITQDSFFHPWDEQYHSLVAKHLSENPFLPILYKNPLLDYDINDWGGNCIWLHKQPFFLWQMALSIKLFGLSYWAVRLPSALMFLMMTVLIFRIGKITFNSSVGYLAAFLFATNNFFLDLIAGVYNTDHNDVAFIFYVTLSIWASIEYSISKNKKYIYLIGLFSGIAILNKWLVGLLVYSGWAFAILLNAETTFKQKVSDFKFFFIAFGITLSVVIPWQIYILFKFPIQSKFEYLSSSSHLFNVVEGHDGTIWYHFTMLIEQYGMLFAILLPFAMIVTFRELKNKQLRVGLLSYLLITYLFFSIAATKMPLFCSIVVSIIYLCLGNLLSKIYSLLNYQNFRQLFSFFIFCSLIFIFFLNIDIEKIQANHTEWNSAPNAWYRKRKVKAASFAQSLAGKFKKGKTVFINCNEIEYIHLMYFDEYIAYNKKPTEQEFAKLKQSNFTIVYLDDFTEIPEYIINDTSIVFIPNYSIKEIKRYSIHLKAKNQKYVCSDIHLKSAIIANRDTAQLWEKLTLMELENNYCLLKDYKNSYISADIGSGSFLSAGRKNVGDWELFTLIKLAGTKVALKASNGKYISVDENSQQLVATANEISENEKFELIVIK